MAGVELERSPKVRSAPMSSEGVPPVVAVMSSAIKHDLTVEHVVQLVWVVRVSHLACIGPPYRQSLQMISKAK